MESNPNEDTRLLRKRPNASQNFFLSSKIRRTISDNPVRKSVDLFDKYLPFFIEQHNFLDELRRLVREGIDKQTKEQEVISTEFCRIEDSPIENPINDEDIGNGNVIECQIAVEDDLDSGSDDVINCKLSEEHSLLSPGVDAIEQEISLSPTNVVPCSSHGDDVMLVSYSRQDCNESPRLITSSNNGEVRCDLVCEGSSQNGTPVWDCRTRPGDAQSILSDDAIDCELLTEEFQDSERLSEDSLEYNITYVSECAVNDNHNNSNISSSYQVHLDEVIESELSFDTDPVSDPVNRAASIPSIINFIDDMCPSASDVIQQQQQQQKPQDKDEDGSLPGHIPDVETLDFPCQFCTSHFRSSADLECHLNTHRGTVLPVPSNPTIPLTIKLKSSPNVISPRYLCNVCFRPYTSNKGLKMHVRYHHTLKQKINESSSVIKPVSPECDTNVLKKPKPSYKCFFCPYLVYRKGAWLEHLTDHKINQGYYNCPECDFRIWHLKLIIYHVSDKHKEFFESHFLYHPNTMDIPPSLTPRLSRALQDCDSLVEVSKNRQIIKTYHSLKKSKKFKFAKWRKPHVKSQSDTNITDSLTSFKSKFIKLSYSPESNGAALPFDCIYCSRHFLTKHEMYSHLYTHINTTDNHFLCPVCNHSYKVPWFLVKHFAFDHQDATPSPKDYSIALPSSSL